MPTPEVFFGSFGVVSDMTQGPVHGDLIRRRRKRLLRTGRWQRSQASGRTDECWRQAVSLARDQRASRVHYSDDPIGSPLSSGLAQCRASARYQLVVA